MTKNNVFNSVRYAVLSVSTVCNLKCKHCITFTPYHRHPCFFPLDEMISDIDRFFRLIGRPLERLDLGGGEPLLHPEIVQLVTYALEHKEERFTQLRILTNGTVPVHEELLDLAEKNDVFFLIDDYGPQLSPAVAQNTAELQRRKIAFRVNTYYGDNQYFGGWIDFGELEDKNYTLEQLEQMRLNCFDIYSESEVSQQRPCDHLHLKNGKICYCDIQQVGASHIPVNEGDFIDLRSEETDEQLREKMKTFKTHLIETCRYCNGFLQNKGRTADITHGNLRVSAGIQLTGEELKRSKLDCH